MSTPVAVPVNPARTAAITKATSPRVASPRTQNILDKGFQGVTLSTESVEVLELLRKQRRAVTFDEITLEDKPSDFHPNDVNLRSFVTSHVVLKSCGIMSAAMDTVTEAPMALAMAKMGGIGVIHRNLSAKEQAAQVNWVRRKIHSGGMIDKPITFRPTVLVSYMQALSNEAGYKFTSFPITDENNKLIGLITRDELDFVESRNPPLSDIMKTREQVITAPEGVGSEEAYAIMRKTKVKKLPVVSKEDKLVGMYVWSDVKNDQRQRDNFSLDDEGHFLVAAAVGVGLSEMSRVSTLVDAGCRMLVLDSSHGACSPALEQMRRIRAKYGSRVQIVVGNIASYDSAKYLLSDPTALPDALKVGIGPGSICTTRRVTGHGIPQVTAIYQVNRACVEHMQAHGVGIPIIADGGIRTSGDIVKALAAGASAVMLGSVFAGCAESPGQLIMKSGKSYKAIRGMGSRAAMEARSGSRLRYKHVDNEHKSEELTTEQKQKMVPEGISGLVEYKGSLEKVMNNLIGGVQAGLAHTGAGNISDFQKKATFWIQSFAGVKEGNPHDVADIRN